MTPAEERAYLRGLALNDWLTTGRGRRLHYADLSDGQVADLGDMVVGPVRLSCGRTAAVVCIPGLFSRDSKGGLPRCSGCCRVTGMPRGLGSPKNSEDCRRVLARARAGVRP